MSMPASSWSEGRQRWSNCKESERDSEKVFHDGIVEFFRFCWNTVVSNLRTWLQKGSMWQEKA